MLKWMHIENLALVERADMEFGPGFNVISGETGAGKSVIMGGVGLLLGERAEKSMIRIGATRCEISGEFQLDEHSRAAVLPVLEEAGIAAREDQSLLVRRVITASSSRNFLNDSPVTLQILHRIGELLVDIHGANENQFLLKVRNQLNMLDHFGRHEAELAETHRIWQDLSALQYEREEFAASMPSAEETARFRRDAAEIEKAAPEAGEDDALAEKHALAAHSRTLIELAFNASNALSESEDSIQDRLGTVRRLLSDMEKCDPNGAARFLQGLDEASEAVSSLSSALSDYAAEVEIDEAAFQAMEERLHVLQTLKRRYGPTLEDVLNHLDSLRSRIDAYENAEQRRQDFDRREKGLRSDLAKACAVLTKKRQTAGTAVAGKTAAELAKLGFKKSEFAVKLLPAEPGPEGADRVEFMFSANPGVPAMPLRDVASSGELSRVMLALKTVLAEADLIPILIFDEIDANIGGETATKVAGEIAVLARSKQILCISHLPQIASRANTHFNVSKESKGEVTHTHIRQLDHAGRVKEIARMLGGGAEAARLAAGMLSDSGDMPKTK
ncbi:MAG: DNA repair protein RecN [Lentisphaeria bacterium]|nr:DNA repair protein RecN [Lentisphaeria bacterium]